MNGIWLIALHAMYCDTQHTGHQSPPQPPRSATAVPTCRESALHWRPSHRLFPVRIGRYGGKYSSAGERVKFNGEFGSSWHFDSLACRGRRRRCGSNWFTARACLRVRAAVRPVRGLQGQEQAGGGRHRPLGAVLGRHHPRSPTAGTGRRARRRAGCQQQHSRSRSLMERLNVGSNNPPWPAPMRCCSRSVGRTRLPPCSTQQNGPRLDNNHEAGE